ncbi:MAG: hypothetical protein WC578_06195 [Candidatus Omnitrophota bacterium]|jgi:hypothetical protein
MTGQLRNLDLKANFVILLKVALGLFFLILGAVAILKWWDFLLMVVKGCVGLFLLLSGIITLAIAKE